ncbi:MAG: hypothetical protein U0822_16325 [Anaerolineae bacterium]
MALTLTTAISALRTELRDPSGLAWPDDGLTEALRNALALYGAVAPRVTSQVYTLSGLAGKDEVTLPSAWNIREVLAFWAPWDTSQPAAAQMASHPFELTAPPNGLVLADGHCFADPEVVRVLYTTDHTLSGLDGAATTTVPASHERGLLLVAQAQAAGSRQRQVAEAENVSSAARLRVEAWARQRQREAKEWLTSAAQSESAYVAWG